MTKVSFANKDFELTPGCSDGVSDIAWSPVGDYVAAASWDNQLRVWEVISGSNQVVAKCAVQHDAPVLCCCWSKDGTKVFSGGADKSIRMLDMATGQSTALPNAHSLPIKSMRWMSSSTPGGPEALVTASWDKTLKYWDLKSSQPIGTVQLPERCQAMDLKGDLLVVACAERNISIININQPLTIFKNMPSPLKWQTRSVSCFHDGSGFAIGSIEGRVHLEWLDEKRKPECRFAFRCHREDDARSRQTTKAYSVNSISFHPTLGTFVTAGSDGLMHFWDKDSKQRLESTPAFGTPIPATAFSHNGNYLAYALSYDWSQGHEGYKPAAPNSIKIHVCQDSEIKPRTSSNFSSFRRR